MKLIRLGLTCSATCVVGVFLLAVMTTLGCNHQDEQSRQISRPVKVARIVDQTDSVMSFAGEVRARYETMLSFRVAGKLLARHVDVGDRVRKGQILARLDQNDYRLAVQDAAGLRSRRSGLLTRRCGEIP
jgi:multidrug efflux pump subunit AcrA (membrane-fusion protein)